MSRISNAVKSFNRIQKAKDVAHALLDPDSIVSVTSALNTINPGRAFRRHLARARKNDAERRAK